MLAAHWRQAIHLHSPHSSSWNGDGNKICLLWPLGWAHYLMLVWQWTFVTNVININSDDGIFQKWLCMLFPKFGVLLFVCLVGWLVCSLPFELSGLLWLSRSQAVGLSILAQERQFNLGHLGDLSLNPATMFWEGKQTGGKTRQGWSNGSVRPDVPTRGLWVTQAASYHLFLQRREKVAMMCLTQLKRNIRGKCHWAWSLILHINK
jgi:hypothetical protein